MHHSIQHHVKHEQRTSPILFWQVIGPGFQEGIKSLVTSGAKSKLP
jgi:hypothetical protein